MIFVFYGLVVAGVALLILDLRGRLVAGSRRAGWCRLIGFGSATVATIVPVKLLFSGGWQWPYPLIPAAYVVLYFAFVVGTYGMWGRLSPALQRLAYAGFLAVVSLPSMVLLALTPAVALAGIALVRSRYEAGGWD